MKDDAKKEGDAMAEKALSRAVDEAMVPLTPRQELDAYLFMMDDALKGALRVMGGIALSPAAERKPCEHLDPIATGHYRESFWCHTCGALSSPSGKWRLPERGK